MIFADHQIKIVAIKALKIAREKLLEAKITPWPQIYTPIFGYEALANASLLHSRQTNLGSKFAQPWVRGLMTLNKRFRLVKREAGAAFDECFEDDLTGEKFYIEVTAQEKTPNSSRQKVFKERARKLRRNYSSDRVSHMVVLWVSDKSINNREHSWGWLLSGPPLYNWLSSDDEEFENGDQTLQSRALATLRDAAKEILGNDLSNGLLKSSDED